MRKEIIGDRSIAGQTHDDAEWLDVEPIARIQLTSEDPAFPRNCAPAMDLQPNRLCPGDEDYAVNLESVTKVEIVIDPDRGRKNNLATLNALRLG